MSNPQEVVLINADGIQNSSVPIIQINYPYQLPEMIIPDSMSVLIKAAPGNGGNILVGPTKTSATDVRQAYPLRPGEFISYRVKNANVIWVSGTVVNDMVLLTAEKNEPNNRSIGGSNA